MLTYAAVGRYIGENVISLGGSFDTSAQLNVTKNGSNNQYLAHLELIKDIFQM